MPVSSVSLLSPDALCGVGIGLLLALAAVRGWTRMKGRQAPVKATKLKDKSAVNDAYETYFEHMPAQVLVQDCSAFEEVFQRLKKEGVVEFGVYYRSHPELEQDLLSVMKLVAANQVALKATGCATLEELQAKITARKFSPYRDIFRAQILHLWMGLRGMEEEMQYVDPMGSERACLARCTVPEISGRLDFSRIQLMLIDVTAAKWTSVARAGDQELLRRILARANILLWWAKVWRDNGRFVWKLSVPPQSFDSPLYRLATAVDFGGLWDNELAPDNEETMHRSDNALQKGLSGYQQEFRIIGPDKVHWLAEDVGIQMLGDNEWSLSGVVIDVTPRHEAEEARKKTEAQLQQILSRADCMIWHAHVTTRADGVFAWSVYSPQSILRTKIFREMAATNHDLHWHMLDVPERDEMHERAVAALRANSSGYEQEFHVRGPDLDIWLHENVSIAPDGPGRWNLVGVITDISDRRMAELELAAEKERLSVTLRAMGEGVITTDRTGAVQYLNPSAASLLRLGKDDVVGRPIKEMLALQDGLNGSPVESPAVTVLREESLVEFPIQTVLRSHDGVLHRVEGCSAPVHDAQKRTVGTVTVIRDITDRHHLEEELQRASRMESIGILAGGIAHDFNNILTAIMGNLTLARLDAESLPVVQASLRDAQKAVVRARDLTQQLLTFSKGGDPVRAAVQLRELVFEIAHFVLHGSAVKTEYDLPENLWPANVDKGQVGQVVQNLVINAVQAMPAGGTLRIYGRNDSIRQGAMLPLASGEYVCISVQDSGVGIKSEDMARIFDPFYTTKSQGSGLGLATAYSIVKKHKGHIEVESELGHGSIFHIWLPAMPNVRVLPDPSNKVDAEKLSGRVLFMDDELSIRQIAAKLLKRNGLDVVEAMDGETAVRLYTQALAENKRFDLVVMDLTVPGAMGGAEALAELNKIDPAVRAIVSSGYSSNPILANYEKHGFLGMVAKPYEVDDLLKVVREVLAIK